MRWRRRSASVVCVAAALAVIGAGHASPAKAPKCPLTSTQVSAAVGEKLPGPKAPLNAYETCVFGRSRPGNYHVLQISVYTPATLKSFGSSAAAYLKQNRQPSASTVKGVGTKAYVQGTDIWAGSRSGAVLDIGADFVISKAALVKLARAALPKV